ISGATLVGKVDGDDVTLGNATTGTFAQAGIGAGIAVATAPMTISGDDIGNYALTQPTLSANITQAPLTITADNKSKEYGSADPVFTVAYATFVGGDTSNVVSGLEVNRAAGEEPGDYAITPSNAVAANYSISFSTGTLTIAKSSRTVTFTPDTPQAYNTINDLSAHASVSVGTGTWTFTVQSGPGTIVDGTNLWIGYDDVTVRAAISETATNVSAYADAVVAVTVPLWNPTTNSIPWSDNFESYYNGTPLINGITGWHASASSCLVQTNVKYTGTQAAMIPIDTTLSNRFDNTYTRIVRMEMYMRLPLYNGTNYPALTNNVAVQFFVNSNGYFVVGDGTNWRKVTTMANGADAIPITNTYFTRIQLNLRYKNHTWNLKAWTNDTDLVASTYYMNFTSNLNTFAGFDIYSGNSTNYVDDVSVTNIDFNLLPAINDVSFDAIESIGDAQPAEIDDIINE
ncbi:MAG: MBG domain-containing protein, partial [Kiritimatiellia bacterium]|nr:MBG domain-containing protein [Kiritimatiellia bacterium]